jgi:hypothetical protein
VATLKTFGLDSSQLFLQGAGSLNLGEEDYNMTFQPASGAPLQLGGSFAQPKLTATPPPPAATPAPVPTTPQARPDICPATLASARFGQTGPIALSQAGSSTPTAPANNNAPKNLLNSLLGQ